MKNLKIYRVLPLAFIVFAILGARLQWSKKYFYIPTDDQGYVYADPPLDVRELLDNTCGPCHIQAHQRPRAELYLGDWAGIDAGGVLSQSLGVKIYDYTNSDPLTALMIRKPLANSGTLHGGIKIPEAHPTIQAIRNWILAGTPQAAVDPSPGSGDPVTYLGGGANPIVVYSRRQRKNGSFTGLMGNAPSGAIWRMEYNAATNAVISNVSLTGTVCSDAQSPVVSLDGTKMAFACFENGNWNIWEMDTLDDNNAGGSARRITNEPGNEVQPMYLPYLPDGTQARAGEGGVVYISDSRNVVDEYDQDRTLSLFVCDTNGGNSRLIDPNPSHSVHPLLSSEGMMLFTRWEHSELQGQNFMSIHQLTAADYLTAGSGEFGVFGEHKIGGNAYHEVSEIVDGANQDRIIARYSTRNNQGGALIGPQVARLQGDVNTHPDANIIFAGDMGGNNMNENTANRMFQQPEALLSNNFAVAMSTLTSISSSTNPFNGNIVTTRNYGDFRLFTFNLAGSPAVGANLTLLLEDAGWQLSEPKAVFVRPRPRQIAQPLNLNSSHGTVTSGNVTNRQNDGQPNGFTVSDVGGVRILRALPKSQGFDFGRQRGIPTQILGVVPVASDGSFSARVPGNVPIAFQVLDRQGRVLVNHKPWYHVQPGGVESCKGCHAEHDTADPILPYLARSGVDPALLGGEAEEFDFMRDIQPILNANCMPCHDHKKTQGAPHPWLTAEWTPANVSVSYQELTGMNLVTIGNDNTSPLMWKLTGTQLNVTPPVPYPANPGPGIISHAGMLNEDQLATISRWIGAGAHMRTVIARTTNLRQLDPVVYRNTIRPILQASCGACHFTPGGPGTNAFDLAPDPDADNLDEEEENQIDEISRRVNFMVAGASMLLRKALPESVGGVTHAGGSHWAIGDPAYNAIYAWIVAANPALAPGVLSTDIVNVKNYPNPFKDNTMIVYGLQGAAASKVTINIYSQNGKLIRELSGTLNGGASIGWNQVSWDGRDMNGKVVGNDVYFYKINAEFGDGTKKEFRGKCVKVK